MLTAWVHRHTAWMTNIFCNKLNLWNTVLFSLFLHPLSFLHSPSFLHTSSFPHPSSIPSPSSIAPPSFIPPPSPSLILPPSPSSIPPPSSFLRFSDFLIISTSFSSLSAYTVPFNPFSVYPSLFFYSITLLLLFSYTYLFSLNSSFLCHSNFPFSNFYSICGYL